MTSAPTAARPVPSREELRRLIRTIESRPLRPRPEHRAALQPPRAVEDALPGRWERQDGSLYLRHAVFDVAYEHGRTSCAPLATASEHLLTLLGGRDELTGVEVHDLLFLDIETTGLGGAGAMVFLVTTAYLAGGELHLRQYLAGSPADEGTLLTRLRADIRETHDEAVLVTYNGRTFDTPILDQRATMHRLRGSFESLAHIDLLSPVRRGFRGVLPSCRLAVIEERFLGVTRPSDEVSGGDVPTWYFRYLRTADARHLVPLVTHNADDVLSLVALLARLADLEDGATGSGLEHLAMGRIHAGAGNDEGARRHLEAAGNRLAPSLARDECLFALAALYRRAGHPDLAVPLWREVAARPGAPAARALIEIAKHLEHVARDPASALAHVERAVASAGSTPDLLRRHERLAQKLARAMARTAVA